MRAVSVFDLNLNLRHIVDVNGNKNKKEEASLPVELKNVDLDILKDRTTDIPGLIEYAREVGGFDIVPNQEGAINGKSIIALKGQTQIQLDMILEQMKVLAKQARNIQDRVELSNEVYQAQMNFEPIIGEIYFLFEKENGKKVMSMISPEEWAGRKGFKKFLCEVELMADHTWKVLRSADED